MINEQNEEKPLKNTQKTLIDQIPKQSLTNTKKNGNKVHQTLAITLHKKFIQHLN
jgi:hypothetical protein